MRLTLPQSLQMVSEATGRRRPAELGKKAKRSDRSESNAPLEFFGVRPILNMHFSGTRRIR